MTIRIKGDFGKLEAMRLLIAQAPDVLETMSQQMAEETVGLLKDQHRAEKDPYGAGWKRKKRPDGRKVLSGKTSRLKGGWHVVRARKGSFTVAPSVTYAAWHQSGTRRMPQRLLVPTKGRGLPVHWSRMYREVAVDTMTVHFGSLKGGKIGIISAKLGGLKRRFAPGALARKAFRAAIEST